MDDFRILLHKLATLLLAFASWATLFQSAIAEQNATPGRVPNIVLILADDLGYAELGSYGQTKIRTPALDRLAKQGLRFTNYYAGNAVCATSRCVLMTGLHTGHCVVRDNREVQPEGQYPLPKDAVTIAELLHSRGYVTGATGKWGLGAPGSVGDPNNQGFDFFYGYNCQRHAHNHYPKYLWRNQQREELDGQQHSHDLCEREALKFIDDNQRKPFFLYIPFAIPHLALQVPDDSLAEYKGVWEDPAYDGKKGYRAHLTPRAAYAAMVTRMDRSVGRVLDKLQELKLDENTLVMFSSDNGPTYNRLGGSDSEFFQSAGNLRGFKGSLYEGGIRVPLIASWPGTIKADQTSDLPCAAYDLLPTFGELAGATTPDKCDGLSLAPTLTGRGKQTPHAFLYWEFPGYAGQQAIRLGHWKGVRQKLARGHTQWELYDLEADPSEAHDLASTRPEIVKEIVAIAAREHVPSAEFPLQSVDTKK
ncbi:MAG TPA: arylsulfatase [Pirellulaceae bacterium]|nr:arylsulfatase [Pirellulaceae bacterium]